MKFSVLLALSVNFPRWLYHDCGQEEQYYSKII